MIGTKISQYEIFEKLGEGGMGVVYKAHDTKLDRIVALKFLPPFLSGDLNEKERFYQEARAASSLIHTNVAVIFEVNEYEGRVFLAMEYVEGRTLKQLIEEGEPISVKKALDIAIQAGEGLAAAHEKGIVHRDVKSDNIMITPKGQVKVMDFGLAKIRGATKLTKAGSTIGTAAYMSPEQAQGEEVDLRSDIFSFGVVLYELLTGRLPFRGEHQAALIYSLINEDPAPLARYNEKTGPELERVVMKALAKDREERYQHIDDLLADVRRERKQLEYARQGYVTTRTISQTAPQVLRERNLRKILIPVIALVVLVAIGVVLFILRQGSPVTAHDGSSRKMLVVLPFDNLGTPEEDYFADGITEEITGRLSGLSGLGVIARTSAMQYKKTTKTLQQIGNELGVQYVLQGTIRWGTAPDGGKRVRINPALVNVADGTQVWSQPYDAVFSDVFKLQSDIASEVANALGMTLLQPERASLESHPTENSAAYDFYLRGINYYRRSYEYQDIRIALDMFQKAIDLDPKFSLAYAKIAETEAEIYWFYFDHTPERLAKAKKAADEALRLDPNSVDGHLSMGFYYYWGFLDYDNALREFFIAQKSRPDDSNILLAIGSVYRRQGKMNEAASMMIKAAALDPRSSEVAYNTSQTYCLLHRYQEAERMINAAISLAPDVLDRYAFKILICLLSSGDTARAQAVLKDASSIPGYENHWSIRQARIWIASLEGKYPEMLTLASASPEAMVDNQFEYVPKYQVIAFAYVMMNKPDEAKRAYDTARIMLERKITEQPEDARYHSALGIAYAGLGRKEDAFLEGKQGVKLLPLGQEAWRGAYRLRDLALIETMVGDYDAAIDNLETLLSSPTDLSATFVRMNPVWSRLRGQPRFQKLVAERKEG